MKAVDQLLLASHTDSSQHRASHLAELILDQIQPRAVLRREHKDEALRYRVQVAPRLFGVRMFCYLENGHLDGSSTETRNSTCDTRWLPDPWGTHHVQSLFQTSARPACATGTYRLI